MRGFKKVDTRRKASTNLAVYSVQLKKTLEVSHQMSYHRKEGLHLKMELDQCVLTLKFSEGLLDQNRKELYADTSRHVKIK